MLRKGKEEEEEEEEENEEEDEEEEEEAVYQFCLVTVDTVEPTALLWILTTFT